MLSSISGTEGFCSKWTGGCVFVPLQRCDAYLVVKWSLIPGQGTVMSLRSQTVP